MIGKRRVNQGLEFKKVTAGTPSHSYTHTNEMFPSCWFHPPCVCERAFFVREHSEDLKYQDEMSASLEKVLPRQTRHNGGNDGDEFSGLLMDLLLEQDE